MEIEIKATYENEEKVKAILEKLGAEKKKVKHQIDEYYNPPSIDTRETNEYIRLRHKSGSNEGVFAHHINLSDGVNKEYEVDVGNIKVFKEMLAGLKFPLLGTIDKKRETYIYDQFKITFDDVKDIGKFIEIEVDGEESEIDEKREACMKMLEELGIPRDKICKKIWLCDIATGRIKYPQR